MVVAEMVLQIVVQGLVVGDVAFVTTAADVKCWAVVVTNIEGVVVVLNGNVVVLFFVVVVADVEVSVLVVLIIGIVVAAGRIVVVVGTFTRGELEAMGIDWVDGLDRKDETLLLVVEDVDIDRLVEEYAVVDGIGVR